MIGLQRLAIPSCPPAKCPPAKCPTFSLDLPAVIVVFIDILPNWGLFGIIKQICHASVGILTECLPEDGWFSRGRNHPPEAYLYNIKRLRAVRDDTCYVVCICFMYTF